MPLIGQSAGDDLVFVVAGAILLAVLLGLFRTACSSLSISQAVAHLRAAIKAIRTWDRTTADEVDIIVREKLQKQKVGQFRRMLQILSIFLIPFTFNLMFTILTHGIRWYTPAQDVIHLLLHGGATLTLIHPGVLSWRTLDVFYAIVFLLMATYISPFACRPEFLAEAL
mmetsp:Transcript_149291/g.362596  ORF Transcript_149291/g.362596 Transcript_149291/m.362596 type:complete len:169 (-) Transcript_149291:10-516(-)